MASVHYTKEELETIKKFLDDALDYEMKSRKHWLKEASMKEDETTLVHLATQANGRVETIANYQQQVDSSVGFMDKHQFETCLIFIK